MNSVKKLHRLIIDTSNIIDKFNHIANAFNFYKGGMKAVIEYFIDQHHVLHYGERMANLINEIVEKYENSGQYINGWYDQSNVYSSWDIQVFAEELCSELSILLSEIVGDIPCSIESRKWLHNDLIIEVILPS